MGRLKFSRKTRSLITQERQTDIHNNKCAGTGTLRLSLLYFIIISLGFSLRVPVRGVKARLPGSSHFRSIPADLPFLLFPKKGTLAGIHGVQGLGTLLQPARATRHTSWNLERAKGGMRVNQDENQMTNSVGTSFLTDITLLFGGENWARSSHLT